VVNNSLKEIMKECVEKCSLKSKKLSLDNMNQMMSFLLGKIKVNVPAGVFDDEDLLKELNKHSDLAA
jgi:hypothetical protein